MLTTKDKIDLLGKFIALVALLFSIASYLNSNFQDIRTQKYTETNNLINEYRGAVSNSESRLRGYLAYYTSQLDINDPNVMPNDKFALIMMSVIEGSASTDNTSPRYLLDLESVTAFYKQVMFCVKQAVCERELALAYFCARHEGFIGDHRRVIDFLESEIGLRGIDHDWMYFTENCS